MSTPHTFYTLFMRNTAVRKHAFCLLYCEDCEEILKERMNGDICRKLLRNFWRYHWMNFCLKFRRNISHLRFLINKEACVSHTSPNQLTTSHTFHASDVLLFIWKDKEQIILLISEDNIMRVLQLNFFPLSYLVRYMELFRNAIEKYSTPCYRCCPCFLCTIQVLFIRKLFIRKYY